MIFSPTKTLIFSLPYYRTTWSLSVEIVGSEQRSTTEFTHRRTDFQKQAGRAGRDCPARSAGADRRTGGANSGCNATTMTKKHARKLLLVQQQGHHQLTKSIMTGRECLRLGALPVLQSTTFRATFLAAQRSAASSESRVADPGRSVEECREGR